MLRNGLILAAMILVGVGLTLLFDRQFSAPEIITQNEAYVQGVPVPDFSFNDKNGLTHDIADYRGKIVVLNFWATWCPPCVKEMPLFMDMAKEYADDVIFVGLSNDFKSETMQDFLTTLAAQKPEASAQENVKFVFDENAEITRNIFQTHRLPETIIIDREGIMREKLVGADWDYLDLQAIIQKY